MTRAPGALTPPGTKPPVTTRVRLRFTKLGKIRWTSHRDVARMWERALRRIDLPVAWSSGFAPRPKVSFGLALPTGHESLAEYLDIDLADNPAADVVLADLAALPGRLSAVLPSGVDAVAAAVVAPGSPSLQEMVTSCTWSWSVTGPTDDLADRVAALLDAPTVVVTRTRKGVEVTDDIRSAVLELRVDGVRLEAELAAAPRSIRPSEVVTALGPDLVEADTRRINQWTSRDGARCEPLGVPAATDAPHALERAS